MPGSLILTTERLAPYIGGEAQIQSQVEGYIYRGEISMAEVADSKLKLTFAWQAKGEDYPPIPKRWVEVNGYESYEIDIDLCGISNIGPSSSGGDDRIAINYQIIGELIVLYPANGSKFDRTLVQKADETATAE